MKPKSINGLFKPKTREEINKAFKRQYGYEYFEGKEIVEKFKELGIACKIVHNKRGPGLAGPVYYQLSYFLITYDNNNGEGIVLGVLLSKNETDKLLKNLNNDMDSDFYFYYTNKIESFDNIEILGILNDESRKNKK